MIAPTVRRSWSPTNESRRQSRSPSPLLRVEQARQAAARLNHGLLTRAAKCYAPYMSPQAVSEARNRGGAVAGVKVQMLADPDHALQYAMHLLGFARQITGGDDVDVLTALCAEQQADGEEDMAQVDLLANPTPENKRKYVERADEAIAKLQAARDAVARSLEGDE